MSGNTGKIILGVLGVALLWAVMRDPPRTGDAPKPTATAAQTAPTYDKSPAAEAKRKKLLEDAGKGGLVGKVDCRSEGADVWVNRMFDDITIDQKRGLAATVHEWCFSGPDIGFVRIRSNQSDKELGMYTPSLGLDLE